jgi:hypothetical protein
LNTHQYALSATVVDDTTLQVTISVTTEVDGSNMLLEASVDSFTTILFSATLAYNNPQSSTTTLSFTNLNDTMKQFSTSTSDLPGTDTKGLDVSVVTVPTNYFNDTSESFSNSFVLNVVSSFNTSSSVQRRALASTTQYTFENKTSYLEFSIDSKTTGGNIVELWMWASASVNTMASLNLINGVKTLSLLYNSTDISTPITSKTNCNFAFNTIYKLNTAIVSPTQSGQQSWISTATLTVVKTGATVCSYAINLQPFSPSNFFLNTFTLILSQSSGLLGARSIRAATNSSDDSSLMAVYVNSMGLECQKGAVCSTVSSTSSSTTSSPFFSNIPVPVIVGAVIGGIVLVLIVGFVVIVVVVVRQLRRKRKVAIYEDASSEIQETIPEEDTGVRNVITYDAFVEEAPKEEWAQQ